MILSRTPFRVTLGGGGTDLPSYYEKFGGFIFAMGIDRYMYVMCHHTPQEPWIRLHYTQSENCSGLDEVRHELAREALRLMDVRSHIELSSLADISAGTGMGSSGAYLVGLLNCLHMMTGREAGPGDLASEACHIELDILEKGIGKQDQYMAAFGGLTTLDISASGHVTVRRVELSDEARAGFVRNTLIFYTGVRRDALEVLSDQNDALKAADAGSAAVGESLSFIKELGHRILDAVSAGDFDSWGDMLHQHWTHKRKLSAKVSWSDIDDLYDHVRREFGVLGGKVIGAGGGGFLMLYCPERQQELQAYMAARNMPRLDYAIEPSGSVAFDTAKNFR